MAALNTENPLHLTYKNDLVSIAVLGGIKLEALERLRGTLKVQLNKSARPPLRHNLDLYSDTQLDRFAKKCAEKLEIGASLISASFYELIEELEKYRLSQIKEREERAKPTTIELTTKEQETAINFLKEPNLLEKTNDLIGKSGVIGEDINRQIMYLVFTKRKQQQPLHVISFGSSGTGKTHLQEKVSECMPPEDIIGITTLSDNAFYYFERKALSHKIIIIEDLDGFVGALYPLRELQTKKKIVKTIVRKDSNGKTKTEHLIVEGPVCVGGCTTKEGIYEDNANRSFLLYLNESNAQDQKIMDYQRRAASGNINPHQETEVQEFLQNVQRVLKPVKIINPFAEKLVLPESVFKPRRTNSHYLQFIEAVTFYHQFQRESKFDKKTGEEYIEVTIEDIENANYLLKDVLLRKSDELTGSCRNYLEDVKTYLKSQKKKQFNAFEIRKALRVPKTSQWRYHRQLEDSYLIKKVKKKDKQTNQYQVTDEKEYQQMEAQIQTVLDDCLEHIKKSVCGDSPCSSVPKRSKSKVERSTK
ncbi:hypothetical protein AEQU3_02235 [Aequorivita antarctica]|nr:hypothetical protein AEQU3_02235 [Aequorivita antarctica]